MDDKVNFETTNELIVGVMERQIKWAAKIKAKQEQFNK